MSNLIRSTTDLAMHIIAAYPCPGDILIDATCGNGHDTVALARMQPGRLFAFDRQEQAVAATRQRLCEAGFGEELSAGTFCIEPLRHEEMEDRLLAEFPRGEFAKVIVFNLGYLPGGDKTITTSRDSTLAAVRSSLRLLSRDGLLCITMYSGHAAGKEEKEALLSFAAALDPKKWHAEYINMLNQIKDPPEILLITKKQPI